MKVKILKNMPFAGIDSEHILDTDGGFRIIAGIYAHNIHYSKENVKVLIRDGWIEEIKEIKTLEEKIFNWYEVNHRAYSSKNEWQKAMSKECAKIAVDHFKGMERMAEEIGRVLTEEQLFIILENTISHEALGLDGIDSGFFSRVVQAIVEAQKKVGTFEEK